MSVVQMWLAGLITLGALYLVFSKDSNTVGALGAVQKLLSGTQHTAMTGKAA